MKHPYEDLPAEFLTCPDRTAQALRNGIAMLTGDTSGETILPFWVADMDFQSPRRSRCYSS